MIIVGNPVCVVAVIGVLAEEYVKVLGAAELFANTLKVS